MTIKGSIERDDDELLEQYKAAYRRANGYDVGVRHQGGRFYIRIVACDVELSRSRQDFRRMRDALLARAEELERERTVG